jgi:hypothetical protein
LIIFYNKAYAKKDGQLADFFVPRCFAGSESRRAERVIAKYRGIEKDPVTARKTGSLVWSVELYFGIDVCFWLLYKIFIQKLI